MVEGGAVPVEQNLTWSKCRFELFDYQGKANQTTAAHITFVNDGGEEFEQYYSVGSPDRFVPSKDGKTLVAVGAAQALSKSSNFHHLMHALVNAGYPESDIEEDISTLEGLVAYHIGMPEPKRAGLAPRPLAEGETQREKIISVPSSIVSMPGETKKGAKKASKSAGSSSEVLEHAVEFASSQVDEADGAVTLQDIASAVFSDYAGDDKKAVAKVIFQGEFMAAMTAKGYDVDGEEISKA
jgi:hypothetical protein